jgi:hypothetical protein
VKAKLRLPANVRMGWLFLAGAIVSAVIGAVVSVYVPKWLDSPDPAPIAVNVVSNPMNVDTWAQDRTSWHS